MPSGFRGAQTAISHCRTPEPSRTNPMPSTWMSVISLDGPHIKSSAISVSPVHSLPCRARCARVATVWARRLKAAEAIHSIPSVCHSDATSSVHSNFCPGRLLHAACAWIPRSLFWRNPPALLVAMIEAIHGCKRRLKYPSELVSSARSLAASRSSSIFNGLRESPAYPGLTSQTTEIRRCRSIFTWENLFDSNFSPCSVLSSLGRTELVPHHKLSLFHFAHIKVELKDHRFSPRTYSCFYNFPRETFLVSIVFEFLFYIIPLSLTSHLPHFQGSPKCALGTRIPRASCRVCGLFQAGTRSTPTWLFRRLALRARTHCEIALQLPARVRVLPHMQRYIYDGWTHVSDETLAAPLVVNSGLPSTRFRRFCPSTLHLVSNAVFWKTPRFSEVITEIPLTYK